MAFIDDYSHYVTIKFLKLKSDITQKIKDYTEWIRTQSGCTVKAFRFDGGGEFMSNSLKRWLNKLGIECQASAPYSPQQHRVAERPNCTLVELMRTMLIDTKLPKFLWVEAILHAAYIRNQAMTTPLTGKTPYEAMFNRKPDISHLRLFGNNVYILDKSQNRSKLDPKVIKRTFVGYEDGPWAIRYYDANTRRILISRNYKFIEETREASEEVKLDEMVEVMEVADGDGDVVRGGAETEMRDERESETEIIGEGEVMTNQTLTKEQPPKPVEVRTSEKNTTPIPPHSHPQHTRDLIDYWKLHNLAT